MSDEASKGHQPTQVGALSEGVSLAPGRDTVASEMSRLLDLSAQQAADVRVLEAAVAVVSRALDDLVGACTDADGKPRTPERGAVMRARSMLPPACKHALKKAERRS